MYTARVAITTTTEPGPIGRVPELRAAATRLGWLGASGSNRGSGLGLALTGLLLAAWPLACQRTKESGPEPRGLEVPTPAATGPAETRRDLAEEPSVQDSSLVGVRNRGVLRVAAQATDLEALPRVGSTTALDVAQARRLASTLEVGIRWVSVPTATNPAEALLQGRADLVLPHSALGRSTPPGVSLTAPVRFTRTVLVVGRAAAPGPKRVEELAGKEVMLQPGATARQRIAELNKTLRRPIAVKDLPASLDGLEVLRGVGGGTIGPSVAFQEDLDVYRTYADDVVPGPVLSERVAVAWGLRAEALDLHDAVTGAVFGDALTEHRNTRYRGDLDEIKKRGSLRVGMLNNAASYFIYRGQEVGFQYEVASLLASRLGVRLEVVVPERPGAMLDLLHEDRVDLVPVVATTGDDAVLMTEPFSTADFVLVQPSQEAKIDSVEGLRDRVIHIRQTSVYLPHLKALNDRGAGLKIVGVSEDLETEDLIAQVGEGQIPLTVANSVLLKIEQIHRRDVQAAMVIARDQPLRYAARRDAPKLVERMDRLIMREKSGPAFAAIVDKYFRNDNRMAELLAVEASESGTISPYDDLAREFGRQYDIDWRLILAQMYKESRFDPRARSWVGAVGLMQVMPRTGAEMGFRDLWDPRQNVHAGVKYLTGLTKRIEPEVPLRQRVRFALAGYNAGFEHVNDARVLAARMGWDRDRWFGNVERAMVLLAQPKYAQKARHGFCRGNEPVSYVSEIQSKYDAFVALMPAADLPDLSAE